MAAADVDVGYLATHLGLAEENLIAVTTNPTIELVIAVLSAVVAKGQEYNEIYTQKLQLEVQLETSVRGAEAQRDASNETAKKALKDVEELRQKLKAEETKRQALENELQTIKSSSSTSLSDIETLRVRIASLETSNREALAIIDTKNSANDTLSQELQAQHQKNLKLNQEITSLQQAVQNANNTANSAKFKEQSLQQQLEMAHRSADFFENELKTKTAEALKYRKEKGARITELQRMNDDATANIESLKRTEEQLRKRIEEAQKKADEGWSKVQQLQEAAARSEEGFRQELDASQRLVNLKDQQTLTHKNRLLEVEQRLDQVKKEGEDAVRKISGELEQANQDHEQAVQEVQNLQAEVARLEAILAGTTDSRAQPGSAPQTPRPMNGSLFGRPASPFATPGTSRKSISATQALDEMFKLKGLLAVEKQRNQALTKDIDEMVEQLEAKRPEIIELQAENERLQREIQTMSHLSDESFRERDLAKKTARKAEGSLKTAQSEVNILRGQVRDLSAQLQMMIFNLEHRDQELTLEEEVQLKRLEKASAFTTDDMSDVDTLITQRLVVFKDIKDLQEKNQDLLKTIHELSEQLKNEEEAAAKQQALQDRQENVQLKGMIKEFEDKFRSYKTRSESIMKERDMFRRLVEEKASGEELASALGRDGVLASIEQNSSVNDDGTEYITLLRDLQQNFDVYRAEQAVDRETMRKQNDALSTENHSLKAENSKLTSQISLKDQRYEMLESNYTASQNENAELRKRNNVLSESAAKQDIRTQQVAEELVESRSQVESLRNENANLKAEKKLWKDIQDRLSQDNDNLLQEKSRLNSLLATQQTLQNERDLSEAEVKRRLQGQIDSLEAELNTTKRKLADEVEEGKKLQLRKEFDAQQSQKRIDELTANLSQIREELVATKTSRDHLQTRVDELTIQLRSAEERAERLQPRPTPRPGSFVPGPDSAIQDADERIQELIHEVSDLKRDLELANTHLENAKAQAEQYKELSQANEEELQRLNAAQDQYTQDMDASLASKDATIKELQQRVEDLSSELARSNSELSALRDSQAEVARHFQEEKAILDEEIKRLKDQEENYTASSQFHQQDLRAQAEIASNAQQAYEGEVAKHGETAKTLSNLRLEYNELKTAAATLRAEAESAKATLLQNENSWDERRKKFEQELSELRARRDDANAQNKLLHQQLESVSSQVTALQQSRNATESLDTIAAQPSSSSEDGLREINNYLRREKDILEVQFDLKVREAKRLQEQFDYIRSQLDETRLKLEQERQSHADRAQATMSHKDLMHKLEELNLFRESSAALRAEARQAQAQVTEKTTKITELESKVQPLEARIEELQSQMAFKEAEMKQLQEDRDRWQKRTEDILSKHGRTDPAEVEELKQTVANLEAERNSLQEAEQPLKEKIQQLEQTIAEKDAGWAASKERMTNQFKERSREQSGKIREGLAEKERLQNEFNEVNTQLTAVKQELDAEKKERLMAAEQIKSFQQQVQTLQEEATALRNANKDPAPVPESQPMPAPAPSSSDGPTSQQIAELEKQLTEAKAALETITMQKASVEQELESLRGQLTTVITERDEALAKAQINTTNGDVAMENGAAPSASLTDEERRALEQKIDEAEAKAAEFEAKALELEEKQAQIVNARSEKMKATLNSRLKEKNELMEKERAEMKDMMDKQQQDFKLQLEQERKIWEMEQISPVKAPTTPSQQPVPATPTVAPATLTPTLDNLSDAEVRNFVNTNTTIKSIITSNIKNKVAEATKKLKDECEQNHMSKADMEQKLAQAKESATKLATVKSTAQLNMAQNQIRAANAKLNVVQTAAQETPARPVGEVWEIAKDAKAPVPPPKQPAMGIAPASPAPTAQQMAANNGTPAKESRPSTAMSLPKPTTTTSNSTTSNNPFASSQQAETTPASNPFSPANSTAQANAQSSQATVQPNNQTKSSIPAPSFPKSGLRQPTGTYQAPGARVARGGGLPRGGGRGGAQNGRQSLNPGAGEFQPGNKRPRVDSEAGANNGTKRVRGGAGGGQ